VHVNADDNVYENGLLLLTYNVDVVVNVLVDVDGFL
jgi:hypothetical protein